MTEGAPAVRTAASVMRMASVRLARRGVIHRSRRSTARGSPPAATVGQWDACDKSDGSYDRTSPSLLALEDTPVRARRVLKRRERRGAGHVGARGGAESLQRGG